LAGYKNFVGDININQLLKALEPAGNTADIVIHNDELKVDSPDSPIPINGLF